MTRSLATLSIRPALAGVFVLLAAGGDALAQRREPPPSREAAQYSFSPIVKATAPAVVNVYVQRRVRTFNSPFADDPFFRRFFGDRFGPSERMQNALGSGVLVSRDGLIVTNTHVVKGGGETTIRVALADKREFDATVLSQDEKSDIAVLKIEGGGQSFPFVELENSDTLEVGDLVLAIGNPFGVGQTVTSGIVSALARTDVAQLEGQVFIQTDAAINPGNSGGALVDMAGKLVGINTAIYSRTGGSLGIGFAIPSNLVRLYVDSAVSGRKIERPWLGAQLETITRELAEQLGLDRVAGAVVTRVRDKSPAARGGLQAGDVIVRVDDVEVTDARSVLYRLTTSGVGHAARFEVIRKGKPQRVTVALERAPEAGRDDVRNLSGPHPLDGARVTNIVPGVADDLGIADDAGVAIASVQEGSTAAGIGFQPGDVIVAVGQRPISNVGELEELLKGRQRVWRIAVKRQGRLIQLQLPG